MNQEKEPAPLSKNVSRLTEKLSREVAKEKDALQRENYRLRALLEKVPIFHHLFMPTAFKAWEELYESGKIEESDANILRELRLLRGKKT